MAASTDDPGDKPSPRHTNGAAAGEQAGGAAKRGYTLTAKVVERTRSAGVTISVERTL